MRASHIHFIRIIISLVLVCVIGLEKGTAQSADSAWIVKNYTKKEQYITMRDGVRLFTSIYIPKDKREKHPFLISRTTYSCAPYGEHRFRDFWDTHYKSYFRENYIMVLQDVRGKYMSEGEFVDVRPFNPNKKGKEIDEASDTYDTVEWLLANISDNNGKVGVIGISYPGFYATEAALSNHPAIVAVSPQAPVTDWFVGDDFHHNGAFFLLDAFGFYAGWGFGSPRPKPTTAPYNAGYNPPIHDAYGFYLRTGPLPEFTRLAGDTIAFWKDLMNHPDYDAWWKARNTRNFCYNIRAAMLEVGGLFDAEDGFGAWNLYKAIEKQSPSTHNQLVMGPWDHGRWYGNEGDRLGNIQFGSNTADWYATHIEVPFFNYYLKGKGNIDTIGEANIFFSGSNEWKKFDQWPPKNVLNTELFLQNKSQLTRQNNSDTGYTKYTSDPSKPVPYTEGVHGDRTIEYMTDDQRFAGSRPDVLVFQTDTLQKDFTIAGPVTADLLVNISATDADFVVKIIDVFPDAFRYSDTDKYQMNGYEMLVRGEVFRGRYRNSYEKPEPFVPGVPANVKISMPDVAHTFKKGHRIMVQVQSSWFPLVDRNPQQLVDIYHAKASDFIPAVIGISHQSKIILPELN